MSKRAGALTPGVALVTGGARGLGNAIAVSFAKEGARAVVLVDINDEATMATGKAAVEAYGCECLAIRANVTVEAEVSGAIDQAVAKYGRIDYAANFAGVMGPSQLIADSDYEAWRRALNVLCDGVMLSMKHEMRQMMKQDSHPVEDGRAPQMGAIVNCASVNSLMSVQGSGCYTAGKHAVYGMTKTAALEGRANNIRVNAVSPGFFRTELVRPLFDRPGAEDFWGGFEKRQGRAATGFEEVGDVVVMMCTTRMSMVNGQNLFIDKYEALRSPSRVILTSISGFTINESSL